MEIRIALGPNGDVQFQMTLPPGGEILAKGMLMEAIRQIERMQEKADTEGASKILQVPPGARLKGL